MRRSLTPTGLWPLLLLAAAFVGLPGCPKRQQVAPVRDAASGLDLGLAALEAGRYKEAEERLTFLIFNFPGSREASDAQYWLGESHFRRRDYVQSQTEFEFYLQSFPNGRYQEQANYQLGLACFLAAPPSSRDQTSTKKAKEILEEFLVLYPDSELRSEVNATLARISRRLAERDFTTAVLYYQAGEFSAALVYYEYLLGHIAQEDWAEDDRLRLAVCYAENGRPEDARPLLESLRATAELPRVRQAAEARLARLP